MTIQKDPEMARAWREAEQRVVLGPALERRWAEEQATREKAELRRELELDDATIQAMIELAPEALGPMSIGRANRGALFNGVRLESSPRWKVLEPKRAWATPETLAALTRAIDRVYEAFPDSPPLFVGHLSRQSGGWIKPHRSHQSGRDADIGYYYLGEPKWYVRATSETLDRARTWVLVKALVTSGDVEYVFMDRTVQVLLHDYARTIGEDAEWLDEVFEYPSRNKRAVIRHTWGHATHLHVRFESPVAQALGERAHRQLVAARKIHRRRYY